MHRAIRTVEDGNILIRARHVTRHVTVEGILSLQRKEDTWLGVEIG